MLLASQLNSKKDQSEDDFTKFIRQKNVLETKLFKKKYERVAKHLSGIPKSDQN